MRGPTCRSTPKLLPLLLTLPLPFTLGCGGSSGPASTGDAAAEAAAQSSGGEVATVDCEGVAFPATIEVEGRTLQLNGLGLREARVFEVDVYVAAFYVERRVTTREEAVDTEQIKQITLHMVRDVEASDAVNAWDEGFRFNSGPERLAMEDRIQRLNDMMSNFYEGDQLTFTYVPDEGIIVSVNGVERGRIEGRDFAQGLLRVWFGADPPDEDLQAGMLGGACN